MLRPLTPGETFPSQELPETSLSGRVGDQPVREHLLPWVPPTLPSAHHPAAVFQGTLFRLAGLQELLS